MELGNHNEKKILHDHLPEFHSALVGSIVKYYGLPVQEKTYLKDLYDN